MANAVVSAPSKKEQKKFIEVEGQQVVENSAEHKALAAMADYEIGKAYVFELAVKSPERELPVVEVNGSRSAPMAHKPFKPYHNIVFTSQIVWNGGRVGIRYYDGCTSIFIHDQPREKDIIDSLIAQTQRRAFIDGKLKVYGEDRQLLLFMNIASWNEESPFKTRTSSTVWKSIDKLKEANEEEEKLDRIQDAFKRAKEATETKMLIHAAYLGIPTLDYDSGNERTITEIRIDYRKEASRNPEYFLETYGNKSIEIQYYIRKALEKGLIDTKYNPHKATWGKNHAEICDISGIKSQEAIETRLFEFSQLEEGQDFILQLQSLFS